MMKRNLADGYGLVPDVDKWRLPYLSKLLEQRQMAYYSGFVSFYVIELYYNISSIQKCHHQPV